MRSINKTKLTLIMLPFMLLASCDNLKTIPHPNDTNLTYWIGEQVSYAQIDSLKYMIKEEIVQCFGCGDFYLDNRYDPVNPIPTDRYYSTDLPEKYVVYNIGSYPDHSSSTKHVIGIEITDPDIHFYGLSLKSTPEEIENKMLVQGFSNVDDVWTQNNYRIRFSENKITLSAPNRTNNEHLVF